MRRKKQKCERKLTTKKRRPKSKTMSAKAGMLLGLEATPVQRTNTLTAPPDPAPRRKTSAEPTFGKKQSDALLSPTSKGSPTIRVVNELRCYCFLFFPFFFLNTTACSQVIQEREQNMHEEKPEKLKSSKKLQKTLKRKSSGKGVHVLTLCEHQPQNSLNGLLLTFNKGEHILLMDRNRSGWCYGCNLTGVGGLFPESCVVKDGNNGEKLPETLNP